jgi:hypothetical protein
MPFIHDVAELQQGVENAGETFRGKARIFLTCTRVHKTLCRYLCGDGHIEHLVLWYSQGNLRCASQGVVL